HSARSLSWGEDCCFAWKAAVRAGSRWASPAHRADSTAPAPALACLGTGGDSRNTDREGFTMRNRTLMIGAVAGVVAALSLSASLAAAAPTSQTLQATVSPSKLSKKTFGGVSLHAVIGTTFDNFTTPGTGPRQTVFTIDPNIKFTNGNVPTCQLSQIQGK